MPYLSDTLKPVLDKIFEERKYCELDPSKTAERRKSSTFRWVNIWDKEVVREIPSFPVLNGGINAFHVLS